LAAALLYNADAPDHVIAAGVLHNTVEKTATCVTDLRSRFGPRITTLVLAVTATTKSPTTTSARQPNANKPPRPERRH
jgi:(p)ppGpp synthase/HD superfamily hydrolase